MSDRQTRERRLLQQKKQNEAKERSDTARAAHTAWRFKFEQRQLRRRALMSLGQRLDTALQRSNIISDVSAQSLDRSHNGKPTSHPPAPINGLLYGSVNGSVHDVYQRRIKILVEGLERELDSHCLRPLAAEFSGLVTEDIENRLITDFEGESPAMVAFLDPSWNRMKNPEYAIRQARIKYGRRPKDGTLVQEVRPLPGE